MQELLSIFHLLVIFISFKVKKNLSVDNFDRFCDKHSEVNARKALCYWHYNYTLLEEAKNFTIQMGNELH